MDPPDFWPVHPENTPAVRALKRPPQPRPAVDDNHHETVDENRQVLECQILDNHLHGLIHCLRQLDTGQCPSEWQNWYMGALRLLESLGTQLPDLYQHAGVADGMTVDNSAVLANLREQHERQRLKELRERAEQARMPGKIQRLRRESEDEHSR